MNISIRSPAVTEKSARRSVIVLKMLISVIAVVAVQGPVKHIHYAYVSCNKFISLFLFDLETMNSNNALSVMTMGDYQ